MTYADLHLAPIDELSEPSSIDERMLKPAEPPSATHRHALEATKAPDHSDMVSLSCMPTIAISRPSGKEAD